MARKSVQSLRIFICILAFVLFVNVVIFEYKGEYLPSLRSETHENDMSVPHLKHDHDAGSSGSIDVPTRIFPKWQGPLPCFPMDEEEFQAKPKRKNAGQLQGIAKPADTGFLFNKLMKVGSSSASGIHIRLATNIALRRPRNATKTTNNAEIYHIHQNNDSHVVDICRARYNHGPAGGYAFQYHRRRKGKSFLWSLVRDPTAQAISYFFFFGVTLKNVPPTEQNFKIWMRRQAYHYFDNLPVDKSSINFQLSFALQYVGFPWLPNGSKGQLQDILRSYDFIGVTERMEETAVLLSILLHLPLSDVLYMSSKVTGSYSLPACKKVASSRELMTPGMKAYLQSDEWKSLIEWPTKLYQAVNASIDRTIDAVVGRDYFQQQLSIFRHAQKVVHQQCKNQTRFPCTPAGEKRPFFQRDCLWRDSACGMSCLDQVATKLDLWDAASCPNNLNVTSKGCESKLTATTTHD